VTVMLVPGMTKTTGMTRWPGIRLAIGIIGL
jgi:hypothetical protein